MKVLDARLVPSGDNAIATGSGTLGYVIARIEFTNDLGMDMTPRISNFVLQDRAGARYQAPRLGLGRLHRDQQLTRAAQEG